MSARWILMRMPLGIALRRLVEKGTLYGAIRKLRGRLDWEGDVDSWRASRTGRA